MKLDFFRHSFFKVSSKGINVLIDPYTDNRAKQDCMVPLIKCQYSKKDFKGTDLILVTHEHFDHFEKETIEAVAKENNSFVVSHDSVLNELSLPADQLKPVNGFGSIELCGAKIDCFSAHHPNSFYPLSYLLTIGDKSVFHAGDTSLVDNFSKINPSIALLPIGGEDTMDVVDAVRAVKMMKPDYAIPMHYDTFNVIKADPMDFKSRIEKSILKTKPVILKPGASFSF